MLIAGEVLELDQTDLFEKIVDIYAKISGCKFKETLTAGKFGKLANFTGMTNSFLLKHDYDIIFARVLFNQQTKQMDFTTFIQALEIISC